MKKLSKIQKAIKFATKTHEVYQKQKRKGKDIAYITHPLTVGIILAYIGADEDVVCAGILHDTMEDSPEEKKVTFEMLQERFGENVAHLVLSVTETDKSLPWEARKKLAKEHIKGFSHDSVLIKSADIIANTKELLQDYKKDGDKIFERFNAPKEKLLKNHLETITVLINQWEDSPLASELKLLSTKLAEITNASPDTESKTRMIKYKDYDKDAVLKCPTCSWEGKPEGNIEYYDTLFDVTCPNCDETLLIVSYAIASIDFFAKIRWYISFISEEITKIKTTPKTKARVLEICDAISSQVLSKIGDVDDETLIETLKQYVDEFRVLIKEIDGDKDEEGAHFLLITHVADILALLKSVE